MKGLIREEVRLIRLKEHTNAVQHDENRPKNFWRTKVTRLSKILQGEKLRISLVKQQVFKQSEVDGQQGRP